ncbi:MAG: RNA polymerase factor sigma-54, partial [Campylobacterota bacterium]|nr:RNA polymerase factor sigma-54 [Campylobacterota bacterium]
MKQQFNFKQKQLPRLSMKTWLPLLQCSLSDLDKHLQVVSNENPCLEISSGYEQSESDLKKGSSAYQNYQNSVSNASSDEIEWLSIAKQSLYEKLDDQIVAPLFPTPISQKIARQIILYINDEGYFDGDISEIAEACETNEHTVESIRQRFAYLEPSGVGAVDYKESFLFQLNDIEMDDELSILVSAVIIQFEQIEKFLGHSRIHDAKEIISHFKNPPALEFMESDPPILPDLFIEFKKDELTIRMNNGFYP